MGGPQPIQVEAILALFQILDIKDSHIKVRYLDLIQRLDQIHLEHHAQKAEAAKARK